MSDLPEEKVLLVSLGGIRPVTEATSFTAALKRKFVIARYALYGIPQVDNHPHH